MRDLSPQWQAPGWYRDPDDPTRLRHWGGRSWSGRRRPRPAWELSSAEWVTADAGDSGGQVLEGPVRPAELPAIATAVTGARDAMRSPRAPTTARRGGQARPATRPPAYSARHTTRRSSSWTRSRRPVMAGALLAVIAMLAMVVSLSVVRPPTYASWVLADQSFVTGANAACRSTLPAVRTTDGATMTATGAQPPSATTIRSQVASVTGLRDRLQALPVAAADRSHVAAWMADWQRYTVAQLAFAAYLEHAPSSTTSGSTLVADAQAVAARADQFALDNGLDDCTLSAHPAAAASAQPYS